MKNITAKKQILSLGIILFFSLIITSCNTSKLHQTPIENFEGTWELSGRSIFDGIKVEISKDDSGKLIGKVVTLNDNKYVKMFVEINDTWITEITRTSNFEFKLKEEKIGSVLFSIYGLGTTQEYKVQFIDKNTIGLGSDNSNPSNSSIKYIRVN